MDEVIKRARLEESETIAALLRTAYHEIAEKYHLSPRVYPAHPSYTTSVQISNEMKSGVEYFFMTRYGQPIGCASVLKVNRDVLFMDRLAVLPSFRGQGCGRLLVEHCLELARQRGAKRLETGITADRDELVEWYRRMGFRFKQPARLHFLPYRVEFMYYDLAEASVPADAE